MQGALIQLAQAVCNESNILLQRVHHWLIKFVEKRNIPFCRELSFIARFPDQMLWPNYLLGMPMAGWARRAPTMVPRERSQFVRCLNSYIMLTPTIGAFGEELALLETRLWTRRLGRKLRRSSRMAPSSARLTIRGSSLICLTDSCHDSQSESSMARLRTQLQEYR